MSIAGLTFFFLFFHNCLTISTPYLLFLPFLLAFLLKFVQAQLILYLIYSICYRFVEPSVQHALKNYYRSTPIDSYTIAIKDEAFSIYFDKISISLMPILMFSCFLGMFFFFYDFLCECPFWQMLKQ